MLNIFSIFLFRFVRPQALDEHFVEAVSCGAHHTFCLARGSRVFSFGHGEYGQQGTGDFGAVGERNRNLLLPREFHLPYDLASGGAPPSIVITITCGHLHTLFGLADGSVWSCGWGVDGVLGHGDKKYRAIPTPVRALEGERVQHLASGWRHNLIVKVRSRADDGDVARRHFALIAFIALGKSVPDAGHIDHICL